MKAVLSKASEPQAPGRRGPRWYFCRHSSVRPQHHTQKTTGGSRSRSTGPPVRCGVTYVSDFAMSASRLTVRLRPAGSSPLRFQTPDCPPLDRTDRIHFLPKASIQTPLERSRGPLLTNQTPSNARRSGLDQLGLLGFIFGALVVCSEFFPRNSPHDPPRAPHAVCGEAAAGSPSTKANSSYCRLLVVAHVAIRPTTIGKADRPWSAK